LKHSPSVADNADKGVRNNIVCIKPNKETHLHRCGAGYILTKNGECATAYHVVDGAKTLEVCSALNPKLNCYRYRNNMLDDDHIREEEDAAILKLHECFDVSNYNEVRLVRSITKELKRRPVWLWTGCTDRDSIDEAIIDVTNQKEVLISNENRNIRKGDSGTPVFIKGRENLLVGLIKDAIDPDWEIDPVTGDRIPIPKEIIGLVSVEPFKRILRNNPGTYLEGKIEFENDNINYSSAKNVEQTLNILDVYMKNIMDRKSLFFADKTNMDLAINTSLESFSFIQRMRQRLEREQTLNNDEEFAVMIYIMGLITKATKKNGFIESYDFFEMAKDLDPIFAEPRYQLALYNLRYIGDMDDAYSELTTALEYDPGNPEVLRSLVVFYLKKAEYDSAYIYLQKIDTLLAEGDPRVPLYWGVYYDQTWRSGLGIEKRKTDISKARGYYAKSLKLQPHFITPANNLIYGFLEELKQDDTTGEMSIKDRERLIEKLRKGISRLEPYISAGLRDIRILETFAHAYAYLSKIGEDKEIKEQDCEKACDIAGHMEEVLDKEELMPFEKEAVKRGFNYTNKECKCKEPEKKIKQNIICIEAEHKKGYIAGFGTGLILSNEGYCITPYHVIQDTCVLFLNLKSKYYNFEKKYSKDELLKRRSEKGDDIAILKIPKDYIDDSLIQSIKMVDSVTEKLEGKSVLIWTGCTGGGLTEGIITDVFGPEKVYIGNVLGVGKGDSGSPVILKETGELVGLVAAAVEEDPHAEGKLLMGFPGDIELISVETIKDLLNQ
jgi:tetratricopeptide (TPR) repeat protein